MSKNRLLINTIFLILWSFITVAGEKQPLPAEDGFLDLRNHNFDQDGPASLKGQWKFFYMEFLNGNQIEERDSFCLINVPSNWKKQNCNGEIIAPDGFGTYSLKVVLDKDYRSRIFTFDVRYIPNASKIFVNGKLVGSGGLPGETKEAMEASLDINLNDFIIDSDTLDIVIQVSNFHLNKGGIYYEILLGEAKGLNHKSELKNAKFFFIIGAIFLMMIYYLILYLLRRKERASAHFSMLCFWIAIYTLCLSGLYYSLMPDFGFSFDYKLKHISIYFALVSMAFYIKGLFNREFHSIVFKIILWGCTVAILSMIVLSAGINAYVFDYFRLFGILVTLYIIFVIIRARLNKEPGAGVFIIGLLIILAATVNDALLGKGIISTTDLLPVGMFCFLVLQTYILSSRFTVSFAKTEELTEELTYINKNLEKIVEERTQEIKEQKEEIEEKNEELKQLVEEVISQRDEIEAQRDMVEDQKHKIEVIHHEIKKSIEYAQRIQSSILLDKEQLEKSVSDSFIFFRPRDIVSGDFYWFASLEGRLVITAADCTGHGVPGAFMSMLGISYLREIVVKEYITHTGVILRKLRKEIISALKQKGEIGEQKDGMDMALVSIEIEKKTMQFSGANNPLYLIRRNDLPPVNGVEPETYDAYGVYEIKGDKMPIAIYERMDKFSTTEIQLYDGDLLYMFSDGFPDQFGGPKGKKFKYKPFKELLARNADKSMEEQKEALNTRFTEWISYEDSYTGNSFEQVDDVVVVGLKI